MVILLYGLDAFRRNRRSKEIIEEFEKKNPAASIQKFDLGGMKSVNGSGEEFLKLKEFTRSQSMFASKKLAVIENVWTSESRTRGKKEEKESKDTKSIKELKKILEMVMDSKELSFLVLEEKLPLTAFKFLLEEPVHVEEFEELTGQKLKKFAEKEAERLGLQLSREASDFLIGYYGSNTWGLMTEFGKLSLLNYDNKKAIEVKDLKRTGDYPQLENIFYFINLFNYEGGLSKKISALEKLFFVREEPAKIFNILAAGNYISPELLRKMADYDVAVKSGKMDYEEVLLDLALI